MVAADSDTLPNHPVNVLRAFFSCYSAYCDTRNMFAVALASGSGRPGTPVPNDLSPGSRPGRPDAHGRGPTPPCSRRGPQTPRGGRASDVAPRTVRSGRNGHSSHRSRWLSGAPPDGGQPDSASQIVVPLVELRWAAKSLAARGGSGIARSTLPSLAASTT